MKKINTAFSLLFAGEAIAIALVWCTQPEEGLLLLGVAGLAGLFSLSLYMVRE
jgi:hypothetical protein